jgi:hypothetical protein
MIRDMKELSAIEKLELVKATMEALGFDFSEITVSEAFELMYEIKKTIIDVREEQRVRKANVEY